MNAESQAEELEVLRSIYEGDSCFREMGPTVFQYKYGEDGHPHSFLLEISWPETYPESKPIVNMEAFYNKHLRINVKEAIKKKLLDEAEMYLGCAVTFTLMEWVKENLELLLTDQPLTLETHVDIESDHEEKVDTSQCPAVKKEKVVAMTKSQKRRHWDKTDGKGEKTRGWNWVDVIKHLSQLGPQPAASTG